MTERNKNRSVFFIISVNRYGITNNPNFRTNGITDTPVGKYS